MGKQLHIAMFPWFAMGHFTPYLHLSNKLAERGLKITLILPTKAKLLLDHLNHHPSLITLHPIIVPHVDPLPPGTETCSDIPFDLQPHLATAMDLARPDLEAIILGLKPDLLFYDLAPWVPEMASKLGNDIKTVSYNVVCAAGLSMNSVPARNLARKRPITVDDVSGPPPGYPSTSVVLRGDHEVKTLLMLGLEFGSGLTFYERISSAKMSCDAIAIQTCREIEGKFVDYLASQFNKPIFLTGPALQEPNPSNTNATLDTTCAEWLGRHGPGSVVYCAFGSQFIIEKDQFQELLLGFEMTKLPFFVALKPPTGCATVEEALPVGFKERVGERGVVHGKWVQQPLILAHPSVGCFVSHCGSGSMWESLSNECQIVLVPQMGEQILCTRLMTEELKVAVEVERDSSNGWVLKESVCEAIKCVTDEGSEVGNMTRKNHAKWKEIFTSKGFVKGYIDTFIQDLEMLVGY